MGPFIKYPVMGCILAWGLVPSAWGAQSGSLRLTPAEIAALPTVSPGAGTSGIAQIRMFVLQGDPASAGPYTIALEVPPNTQIKAHTHKDQRSAVVIRGTWYFGYGTRANEAAIKQLVAGSFYTEPAAIEHFARTGSDGATVYITGWGPSDTVYVEP
jgi:quercetin dioxygenase-like cupin family protein